MNLESLKAPTLIVDKKKVTENINFMANKAKDHNIVLRPHFKTHQSAKVGDRFRLSGIDKITVSSVQMAKYFAAEAWKDITIAFPMNIRETEDILLLAKQVNLNVLISSVETAKFLSKQCKTPLSYFIKIDAGYGRAGVSAENTEKIKQIIDVLQANKSIAFKGFLAHFGNTYYAKGKNEVLKIYADSKERLIKLKNQFLNDYPDLILSVGDTPSATLVNDFEGIDEIRPGNFVFYDLMQYYIGVCTLSQIAVALACPVVDIYPQRNEILIYGGGVHLSKEYTLDNDGNKIFGQIVTLNKDGWEVSEAKAVLRNISKEHGIVSVHPDFIKTVKIGDLVGVLPVHSCLTADLMRQNGGFYFLE